MPRVDVKKSNENTVCVILLRGSEGMMPSSFDADFHCLHTALALRCSANGKKRKNNFGGTSWMLILPVKRGAAAAELIPRLVTALMMSTGFSFSDLVGFDVEKAPRNFRTPF
jgi:hypothetical protein